MIGLSRWRPRFSLHTLFAAIAVACLLSCVGRDALKTAQRHMARSWLEKMGGYTVSLDEWNREHFAAQPDGETLSFFQHWLGDEPVVQVMLPSMATAEKVDYARATFPEAPFISIANPPGPNFF
jgi:hypothetical protein